MAIRKNRISVLYKKDDNECQLIGWYKIRGMTTLKVCMESPFTGLSKCEEIIPSNFTLKELEAKATQCLLKLYEDANEIMQYRDKLERIIAEFHQAIEAKKQKRADMEKRLSQATDSIERCMFGVILDNWHDNQCEWYELLEREGILVDTDMSNFFIIQRQKK